MLTDNEGMTALHGGFVATVIIVDIVQLLIAAGADLHARG